MVEIYLLFSLYLSLVFFYVFSTLHNSPFHIDIIVILFSEFWNSTIDPSLLTYLSHTLTLCQPLVLWKPFIGADLYQNTFHFLCRSTFNKKTSTSILNDKTIRLHKISNRFGKRRRLDWKEWYARLISSFNLELRNFNEAAAL